MPAALPTTLPCLGVTVAIVGSLEVKVTVLSSASSGRTVAVNVSAPPTAKLIVVLSNVTPVGSWGASGCHRNKTNNLKLRITEVA